jgi:hypothetical protein
MDLASRHSNPEWVNLSVITFVFVQGREMNSKKMAKRAAALETCKRLHQVGELNEHLLPVKHEDPIEACAELFPLYIEETKDNVPQQGSSNKDNVPQRGSSNKDKVPQRGSSKRKQQYKKEVCSQFCSPLV